MQQAIRFNLFQLHQASARSSSTPSARADRAGLRGHYWDTEVYVMPFLTTAPQIMEASSGTASRCSTPPAAGPRPRPPGARFPWRTISGEEASAYYAAGTAQYHINADIAYLLMQYVRPPTTSTSWLGTGWRS